MLVGVVVVWLGMVRRGDNGTVGNFKACVAQQQRHDVESVASAGANPATGTLVTMR